MYLSLRRVVGDLEAEVVLATGRDREALLQARNDLVYSGLVAHDQDVVHVYQHGHDQIVQSPGVARRKAHLSIIDWVKPSAFRR